MKTAILFLIFNRPDTTFRVFETIRQAKPPRLYIAADGPRENRPGEKELCIETRSIINKIDWECEVKTLFRKTNLGCGKAVSQAITWFFENEEEGIILEDDILAHPDFFPYCEELLSKYRDNESVRFISGRNHLYDKRVNNDSYYFSSINHVWGWATWRSAWQIYSFDLSNLNEKKFNKALNKYYSKRIYKNYWKIIFFQMKNYMIDTWDYQWTISLIYNNSLCIVPNVNLIQNIGFGIDATHTFDVDNKVSEYKGKSILPLVHPSEILLNRIGDELDIKINNRYISNSVYFRWRIKQLIKQLIK